MSSSQDLGKDKEPAHDTVFGASNTPHSFNEPNNVPSPYTQRNLSGESVGSLRHLPAHLPSLPYPKLTPGSRDSTYGAIYTDYNPPAKGSGNGNSVRGSYALLDGAITDDSPSNLNFQHLYATEGSASSSTLNRKSPDFGRSSPGLGGGKGSHSSGYGSYPPTPNYDAKRSKPSFLKFSSPSLLSRGLLKLPKRHPFSQRYEAPKWRSLAIHTLFSFVAYPFLLIFVVIARERTLFWTRLVIGIGCQLTGMILGWSLLELVRRHLEAAAWAAVIHQSEFQAHPGVRLRDIAPYAGDPVSAYNGLLLLWKRHMYPGTTRKNRVHYDNRPWSIHVIFFLILFGLSAALSFIFGRIVIIGTEVQNQRKSYYEAAIKGDISDADIQRASDAQKAFNGFRLTWTLAPYSNHGGLPPINDLSWKNTSNTSHIDSVYFSEPTKSQLQPDGKGFGTFDEDVLTPPLDNRNLSTSMSVLRAGLSPGSIVRLPQWGIRIKCEKIPDASHNILPISNLSWTYVFIPRNMVGNLLNYFEKPFPTNVDPPSLEPGDQGWPSNVNQSDIFSAASFRNDGASHAYWSDPLYQMGGFVSLEAVLIRLNTTYATKGEFPILGDVVPNINGAATYIGYDAAVCIEVFEPWVVDVYNSTVGSPTALRIVEKGNVVQDFKTRHIKEKMSGRAISDPSVSRTLTSKRVQGVYEAAHQNSINQLVKDNGRDSLYVPSTIAISYTTGQGAYEYTSLSATRFEKARALADARNMLPYFAGSGSIVARVYPDRVVANAFISPVPMTVTLIILFVLGVIAALFVPRLPMGVPRRGFELYSWVAAFCADELVGVGKAGGTSDGPGMAQVGPGQVGLPIGRRMEIEEIEEHIGDVRFRYVS